MLEDVLLSAAKERGARPGFDAASGELEWVLYERAQMLAAVNAVRHQTDAAPVYLEAIADVERCASGHVDYATKFALYCAELALGVRPRA